MPDLVYYRRAMGRTDWERIDVQPRSVVAWNLGQVELGEIWVDGYGSEYKAERGD